jgi:DNA repair photolyase
MPFKAVYIPSGKAREYCEYALNIYDGCPHRCYYCFAPLFRHKTREDFHSNVKLYKNIVERVKRDCEGGALGGETIQLCFTCDPYPTGIDTTPTREIIKILKIGGAHVQILTKNGMAATRDFDLLDGRDKFGVTLTAFSKQESLCIEPGAECPSSRLNALDLAKIRKIGTWVSFEPVIRMSDTLSLLDIVIENKLADTVKIGKLNYFDPPEVIDWGIFGRVAEAKCKSAGQDYYIKEILRAEMEKP